MGPQLWLRRIVESGQAFASLCSASFPLGKRLYFAVVLFSVSVSVLSAFPNRLYIAGQTMPETVAAPHRYTTH